MVANGRNILAVLAAASKETWGMWNAEMGWLFPVLTQTKPSYKQIYMRRVFIRDTISTGRFCVRTMIYI